MQKRKRKILITFYFEILYIKNGDVFHRFEILKGSVPPYCPIKYL